MLLSARRGNQWLLVERFRLSTRLTRTGPKIKIGIDVPHRTSKRSASFQFGRSKVKVTGRKNLKNLASCLLTGGSAGGSSAAGDDCIRGLRHC